MGSDIFGALFASVSGLDSQSTNLSIIANNIANANTVGYKSSQAEFSTLVSGAGSPSNYASGGVIGLNRDLVSQQGLLESTNSATDIAVQGGGLFVVNSAANGSGDVLYTRAGSFTQDSSGNFVNSAGYYLQAWPLSSSGLLPGAPGNTTDLTSSANLSSLTTVNVQSVAGKASATTDVSIGANLNAGQTAYPGSSGDVTMDKNDATNYGINASELILPTTTDGLTQNDAMTVTTSGNPTGYTYQYGGIAYSRNITTGAANGNSGAALQGSPTIASGSGATTPPFVFSAASPTTMIINEDPATAGVTQVGQVVKLNGTNAAGLAVNNITTLDGDYYVTAINGTTNFTVTIPSNITPPSPMSLNTATFTATSGAATVVVTGATLPAGFKNGDSVTLAGVQNIVTGGAVTVYSSAQLDTTFTVSAVSNAGSGSNNGTFTITMGGNAANNGTSTGTASTTVFNNDGDLSASTATVTSRLFAGDILDASNASSPLINTVSNYTGAALSFTITSGTTTSTFTYTSAAPDAELGQFNTLDNLATAISDTSGLSARVLNNQLYISAVNGNAALSFANGSITGSNASPPLAGIDWVGELGLATIAAYAGSDTGRFSTQQGLANLVNASAGLTGTVNNPLSASDVDINVDDPLDTITFADASTNHGSVTAALGLTTSLDGTVPSPFVVQTTGAIGPIYNPLAAAKNMASGAITAQFSRPITVYDSLGAAHNLTAAFINEGVGQWAVEVYAQPATDVDTAATGTTNGLLAYGNITFNGDGTLKSVDSALLKITAAWTNGATASTLNFNWGTAGAIGTGKTDGMSQFNSPYAVNFVNQNGAAVGSLTSVSIGSTGLVTASFSNGQTENLYQIPLAVFANPDDLSAESGNVFGQTSTSGQVELQQAINSGGAGSVVSSSLEQSNVQLADQLTDMIVAQRAYEANTKVISTADTLLSDLDQIIQ